MLKRFLIYGLPVYLIVVEWAMQEVQIIARGSAIGPSLAAVALGLMSWVVVPRGRVIDVGGRRHNVVPQREQLLCEAGWIAVLMMLAAWASALYLAEQASFVVVGSRSVLVSTLIGVCSYVIGIILSEVKEFL